MNALSARLLVVLSLSVLAGYAQEPAPSSRQITLDVVVTDKSGKPVAGLQQSDFKLLDNKQPQNILSFEAFQGAAAASEPVEIVIVSDEVNTAFSRVSYARTQLGKFLEENGGELPRPVSLAFLTDAGIKLSNVDTRDGKALLAQLDQNKPGLRTITRDQGVYGAFDRVGLSINALRQLAGYERPRPGRKLVIFISPGWPLLTGPRENLTSKEEKNIFDQIVGISDELRTAGITLYCVDPLGTSDAGGFETFYYEEFVKGVKKPGQAQMGNLALQVFATQSGGEVFNSSNDIAGEVAKAVTDANAFYALTFESLLGDGPDEFHALDIKLDRAGLKARTRTGYYAQP